MPTERFYRLPKEKAETIRKAAIQEFKRVPPEEVSINKIIQNADISRGSFYTYFEDKYDLLEWLMGDLIGNYRQFYITGLQENSGNLWDVFDRILDHAIQWVDEMGLVEIVGNIMKGTYFSERIANGSIKGCKIEEENSNYLDELYQRVNPACCTLKLEEFHELMMLHAATLICSLRAHYTKKQTLMEIKASYHRCVNLLHYGACFDQSQSEN